MEKDSRMVGTHRPLSEDRGYSILTVNHSSGDIGASAVLVLHGTSPFQAYYRSQRDTEPPRELSKTFSTARGELTVQPDRSGHYTSKIHQTSDTNYKKIELKGSAIELDVYPPPSADFVGNSHGGRGKKSISSCSGNLVDVDVELRVSTSSRQSFELLTNRVV